MDCLDGVHNHQITNLMNQLYCTEIRAINPVTGQLSTWAGPNVPGISFKTAEEYCQQNGLGYCKVIGRAIAEIPTDKNYNPIMEKMINLDTINSN